MEIINPPNFMYKYKAVVSRQSSDQYIRTGDLLMGGAVEP